MRLFLLFHNHKPTRWVTECLTGRRKTTLNVLRPCYVRKIPYKLFPENTSFTNLNLTAKQLIIHFGLFKQYL